MRALWSGLKCACHRARSRIEITAKRWGWETGRGRQCPSRPFDHSTSLKCVQSPAPRTAHTQSKRSHPTPHMHSLCIASASVSRAITGGSPKFNQGLARLARSLRDRKQDAREKLRGGGGRGDWGTGFGRKERGSTGWAFARASGSALL